jgi:hypothetical protein
MTIEPEEIYTFKLTTGEEVVAKVLEIHEDSLVIRTPISTVLSQQGLQMMPTLFSSVLEQNVRLNKNAWVMVAVTRSDVRNSYIEATTGIAPVNKQIITG